MYKLSKDVELTPQHIVAFVDSHITEYAKLNNLYDYYKGQHKILKRSFTDSSKPNNKIVNPFCQYITDMITGYFMGVPVTYNTEDENYINAIKEVFDRNDEQAQNADLAKNTSIFGKTYELLYLNEKTELCFVPLDPRETFLIKDDTINNNPLYGIRHYEVEDVVNKSKTVKVEVYTDSQIFYYNKSENGLALTDVKLHAFGEVPIIEYLNNTEELGDFENVITLVDAYDLMASDSVNSMEYFADAYLLLIGMTAEPDDIAKMKEKRVISVDGEDADAKWLIKEFNDTYVENLKKRLQDDIHTFSKCPRMTDDSFGTSSGIAMRFKLLGLENLCSKKERAFKKGLQKRIKFITDILNIKGSSYTPSAIKITFTRNIPSSWTEIADVISKVQGIVSNETLLAQLPFIDDPKAEAEKKKNETAITPYTVQPTDNSGGGTQ